MLSCFFVLKSFKKSCIFFFRFFREFFGRIFREIFFFQFLRSIKGLQKSVILVLLIFILFSLTYLKNIFFLTYVFYQGLNSKSSPAWKLILFVIKFIDRYFRSYRTHLSPKNRFLRCLHFNFLSLYF